MTSLQKEMYQSYLEGKEERIAHGFDLPGARAIEDVAYLFDTSIKEVCLAISLAEEA